MRLKMRKQREELCLSQQKVAELAGLTRVNYSSIERGRTEPNIDQMIAIANVLKVEPELNFFEDFCDNSYHKSSKEVI